MWFGVGAAIAICAVVAVVLGVLNENLPFKEREIMEGVARPASRWPASPT